MTDPLSMLYPELGASVRAPLADPQAVRALLSSSVQTKFEDSVAAKRAFLQREGDTLVEMARRLALVFNQGGRLLTMGNGGSSTDAAHVAVEFNHPVTVGRPALPAIDLAADVAMMTAVGNDVGFAQVFARQVIAHGRKGDALLGLSTSGNSENLLNAFARGKRDGLCTLALVGGEGGAIAVSTDVDVCVTVPTPSIHRVQECHVLAYHVLWDLVHTLLAQAREDTAKTHP